MRSNKSLERTGIYRGHTVRGSHRQLRHPTKPGRVTVHGKPSDSIAPGTLNSILKQSGLKIISADNLADAAEKIVEAVKEAA